MKEPKIVYTNSAIIINDYNFGDSPSLEWNFKSYDPLTHKYNLFGMYYDEQNRRLYLPRGIDKSFVEKKLQSIAVTDDPIETHIEHCHSYERVKIKIKYFPRDERQKEALRFMLCEGNYSWNKSKSQFSVNLPTGAGKTYCSIATIALEGIRSCIISSQSGLLDQWEARILEYTNLSKRDIGRLTGSQQLLRVINDSSSAMNKKIYLFTHGTLQSFGSTYGWDKIGLLFKKLKIGMKFFDEAHQNFENMCMIDFHSNVYRTYYVTATPTRSASTEIKIFGLYLRNVPFIDLWDENQDPHTKYIAFKYNSNPKPSDVMNCKNAYGLDRNKYVSYLMKNGRFWMAFDYIFNLIEKSGGKALFFVQTNEAILKIKDRIVTLYPEYKHEVGIYTTLTGDNKQYEKEKRFILSTTKSAGAGEDIKGLKYVIVLAEPFKSSLLAQQTLGRARDNNTFYIELVDVGFKQTKRYYEEKKPVFEKYALSTKEILMSQNGLPNMAEDARIDRYNRFKRAVTFNNPSQIEAVKFINDPNYQSAVNAVYFYGE